MLQEDLVKAHFQRMGQDGSYAAFYGARGRDTHDFFARKDRVEEFLLTCMQPGQRVVDVGCGTGPMVDFFCSRGLYYCGVDVAPSMLDSVAQRFRQAPYRDKIDLQLGRSEKIPYPDGSFDIYVGMGLLEYLDDMQPALKEIARVLKRRGLAVLTIPNFTSLNRFVMRNTGFITALHRRWKGGRSNAVNNRQIIHKELAPAALDGSMAGVGFECVGKAFYDYKLICYPVSRLFPNFAYAVNRRIENRGPGFLANGYIGFYMKQA